MMNSRALDANRSLQATCVLVRGKKFCGNDHLDPLMELYRWLPAGKTSPLSAPLTLLKQNVVNSIMARIKTCCAPFYPR